jgi:hypothetical protein
VLLLLIIPFTLVVILPTNKRLESQELDLKSEEAGSLLRRWGRLHAVRSILSGTAFLIFLFTLLGRVESEVRVPIVACVLYYRTAWLEATGSRPHRKVGGYFRSTLTSSARS